MKVWRNAVIACFLLCGGNFAAWAQAPRAQIGLMEVDGKHAFHNQARVKNHAKVPIYDGDRISTGERTSVRVTLLAEGYSGFMQLAENTDPTLCSAARCIVLKMLKGQVLVNARNICLGTRSVSGVTRSLVNLKADGMASELTVIKGGVDLDQPSVVVVGAYERFEVAADGAVKRYSIDAAQAVHDIEWTKNYFKGGSSSSGKTAGIIAGILGAIIVGKAIDDHNDKDDSQKTDTCAIPDTPDTCKKKDEQKPINEVSP